MTERRMCRAKSSRTGKPCQKPPIRGGFVCTTHGGRAPQVRRKANERIADMLAEAIDPNRVLREVGRLAYSDIRQAFDEKGNLRPPAEWPDDFARAVAGVEVVKQNVKSGDGIVDDVIKIKLWDKTGRLTDLMKMHGKLKEGVEHTGSISVKWEGE